MLLKKDMARIRHKKSFVYLNFEGCREMRRTGLTARSFATVHARQNRVPLRFLLMPYATIHGIWNLDIGIYKDWTPEPRSSPAHDKGRPRRAKQNHETVGPWEDSPQNRDSDSICPSAGLSRDYVIDNFRSSRVNEAESKEVWIHSAKIHTLCE
jgi:hypothetical protein